MLYERGETLAWCSVPASCFNICSGEEKRVKVTPHVILDISPPCAGGECTYTVSSVKLFNQWKFSLVLDAKNRWHFIFPIGNTTQKCIFHYFFQHLLQILQGKIPFHRDCSRDAPFAKHALAQNYHMGPFRTDKKRKYSVLKILFEQL